MAKTKTTYTNADVETFIGDTVTEQQKKSDCLALLNIFKKITGAKPRMWGSSIVGFGNYHYKYESGHEGDAPVIAFSPRKDAISLYIYTETEKNKKLLAQLGKFKMGKSCIYIKKLADINRDILAEICSETITFLSKKYTCTFK
ncbi:MAG: DUF1801 domain-containing protein [Chitinophagales bacterium]|nr:DUF1801 domain-containing protein [Chitinophagales bacterium]MDW8419678.1 DUF1801 domain-containing protein [Chitinophagales bacterium]